MDDKNISFKDVSKQHEKLIKSFNLPKWVLKQNCSKCNKPLSCLSLRSIGLKLNAQHIGNFFIEVCCQHCNYGYELHMKNTIKDIKSFIYFLKNDDLDPKMEPDYLISNSENNLVKDIIKGEK
jgi:hypothetical protein